ncbi:uncharacterized protein F5147DRAFT_833174 [Suillus discolor]|uniref:Uncharacterized protein n=1 Tax=Suillus discolor TaxID=1912936 RepID=A0A9P7FJN1_9AGAM|nr:uncharacterized protein F5147DRAFT_833174 [Suillus discolor]KAG2118052.1 hypothetical protein F5147DRAFT_833174 [Suillus discolor]
MNRSQNIHLPVAQEPDWEVNNTEQDPSKIKSAADSFVILQSLKQSREKWLRSTFPKFSSRSRGGKPADAIPPPHTMYNRGRCTLEIGPHIFTETTIFEVHYHPILVHTAHGPTYTQQPGATSSVSASQGSSSTPLLSPLPNSSSIPPTLINQVNAAALSNPTLANLLHLAASGNASMDQLKNLGVTIQQLASSSGVDLGASSMQSAQAQNTATAVASGAASPIQPVYQTKDFDIVIEFRECPTDRWIFPRGLAVGTFTPVPGSMGSYGEITLSTRVPFEQQTKVVLESQPDGQLQPKTPEPQEVVTFIFTGAGAPIWDSVLRWIGSEEKLEENRKILESINKPRRVYLAHRIAEGSLLAQIQNAAVPTFSTKLLRSAAENSNKPKRKAAPRKPPQAQAQPQPQPRSQSQSQSQSQAQSQPPPPPPPQNAGHVQQSAEPAPPPPKKRRQTQPKSTPSLPKIACFACGQTDVPLIMGGRYCRPCVEAGCAIDDIPQVGSSRYSYQSSAQHSRQGSTSHTPDNTRHQSTIASKTHAVFVPYPKASATEQTSNVPIPDAKPS